MQDCIYSFFDNLIMHVDAFGMRKNIRTYKCVGVRVFGECVGCTSSTQVMNIHAGISAQILQMESYST